MVYIKEYGFAGLTVRPPEQRASCPRSAEFGMCTHTFGICGQK